MSGGVYGGDEVGAVVFDIGSRSARVGFAGEDCPKGDVPSFVGVIPDSESKADPPSTRYVFDTLNLGFPREKMEVISFLKDGTIEDWSLFEKMVDFLYEKHVCDEPANHPVLMSEAPWNTRQKREKLTELMFEKYQVPAFFLCKNAALSAYANGRTTALIVDTGAQQTSAVPVYDGYVLQQAVVRSPLAGDFVISECMKYLEEINVDPVPAYMIGSKEQVQPLAPPIWTKKKDLPEVTKSYHTFMQRELVQDFANIALHILDTKFDPTVAAQIPNVRYEFPNGYSQDFGVERFKLCEGLFDPSAISGVAGLFALVDMLCRYRSNSFASVGSGCIFRDSLGNTELAISNVVTTSASLCDTDIRPALYSSVTVVGGNSLLHGFSERLNYELNAKTPPNMKIKVSAAPTTVERRFSAWIGGSILASLGSFQQMWVSKQEYEESGKICVEKKCP